MYRQPGLNRRQHPAEGPTNHLEVNRRPGGVGLRGLTGKVMILAVDVSYRENKAVAAGVLFHAWDDCEPSQVLIAQLSEVAPLFP